MNRLFEISNHLADLYQERAQCGLRTWQIENDLAARKVFLTPAEGWPGKNAEQREIEAARVFAQDQACQEMNEALNDLKQDAADIAGQIEALEAERRAAEWSIRERLANALSGKRENHAPVEEAVFDDAPDQVALGVLDEQGRAEMEQAEYEQENGVHIGPEDVERYMSVEDSAFEELPF